MTARPQLVSDDRAGELSLARRAAAGDEAAFEQLYRAHAGRVFALCVRMSGSRQRATELTQDVFVHVWERLDKWRGESALSSWIYRVAVNLVLSNARGEQRRQKHEITDADERMTHDDARPTTRADERRITHADVGRRTEEAIDLERAIAALPPGARAVFVLHDVEGYQHDEIARMMGTAEGTCRAQLHRARKLLIEALDR